MSEMDAMDSAEVDAFPELTALYNLLVEQLYPERTFTENAAGAFSTTGSKCLDFFGSLVRDTSVTNLIKGFVEAWNEDPDKALKLIMNLRDIRGGKGEKKLPIVLMYVLSCWRPLTYLNNLRHFLDLGCYKDLLTIAELAVRLAGTPSFSRITQLKDADIELKIMAAQLLKDEELLDKEPKAGISLCAKWAPSDNAHFNAKPLRFAQKITKTLGVTKKQYRQKLTKLRARLNVLETLMCGNLWDQIVFQQLPAKAHRMYRCTFNREVNKNKHSSGARKASFARYKRYLVQLKEHRTTIKSTGSQPHEIIKPYIRGWVNVKRGFARGNTCDDLMIDGQWRDLIENLAKSGKFRRCQAVCDVSGSMDGTPMEVAIALGLVVAELTEEPFKNKLITFSEQPEFHTIKGTSLREKVQDVKTMKWGASTDLLKVFEVLLQNAADSPGVQMVETLFIFTDMQFDQANQISVGDTTVWEGHLKSGDRNLSRWETTYQTIQNMYAEKGFAVPNIIFWNLRATHKSFAVEKDQVGTALLSGYSSAIMKALLEGDVTKYEPVAVMDEALKGYDMVKVSEVERVPFSQEEIAKFAKWYYIVQTEIEEHIVPKTKANGKYVRVKVRRSYLRHYHRRDRSGEYEFWA